MNRKKYIKWLISEGKKGVKPIFYRNQRHTVSRKVKIII